MSRLLSVRTAWDFTELGSHLADTRMPLACACTGLTGRLDSRAELRIVLVATEVSMEDISGT